MLERYSRADRVCAIGALLAIVGAFLPWYRYDSGAATVTVNGFRAGLPGLLLVLAALALLLLVAVRQGHVRLGLDRPVREAPLLVAAGCVALAAALAQFVAGSSGTHAVHQGAVIGVLGAVLMAAGGLQQWREDRRMLNPGVLR